MSQLRTPDPVKLVMSLLTGERALLTEVQRELASRYGELDMVSPILDFDFTDYYEREMGPGLVRRLVAFTTLINPEELVPVKIATTTMENTLVVAGKRRINIDPGYVALAHVILATGKGFSHRPYLGQGVYADLTLIYGEGDYRPLPWTYPDYRSAVIVNFMRQARAKYREQLRVMRKKS